MVVAVVMTLTAPACPSAQMLPLEVESRVREVPGVTDVKVDVVWDPPWTPHRISPEGRKKLGIEDDQIEAMKSPGGV